MLQFLLKTVKLYQDKTIWKEWYNSWWNQQLFKKEIIYLLLIGIVFCIIFIRKNYRLLNFILILLTFGSVAYVILWYSQFQAHDYYILIIFPWIYFILLCFFYLLKRKANGIFNSLFIKIIFIILFILSMSYCRRELNDRYCGNRKDLPPFKEYLTIQPYVNSLGISKNDLVISIPDGTNCYTLYMMNRKGYTELHGRNQDSAGIATSINLGAKYLFINTEEYLEKDYVKPFLKEKIGEYGLVRIYKVK